MMAELPSFGAIAGVHCKPKISNYVRTYEEYEWLSLPVSARLRYRLEGETTVYVQS